MKTARLNPYFPRISIRRDGRLFRATAYFYSDPRYHAINKIDPSGTRECPAPPGDICVQEDRLPKDDDEVGGLPPGFSWGTGVYLGGNVSGNDFAEVGDEPSVPTRGQTTCNSSQSLCKSIAIADKLIQLAQDAQPLIIPLLVPDQYYQPSCVQKCIDEVSGRWAAVAGIGGGFAVVGDLVFVGTIASAAAVGLLPALGTAVGVAALGAGTAVAADFTICMIMATDCT